MPIARRSLFPKIDAFGLERIVLRGQIRSDTKPLCRYWKKSSADLGQPICLECVSSTTQKNRLWLNIESTHAAEIVMDFSIMGLPAMPVAGVLTEKNFLAFFGWFAKQPKYQTTMFSTLAIADLPSKGTGFPDSKSDGLTLSGLKFDFPSTHPWQWLAIEKCGTRLSYTGQSKPVFKLDPTRINLRFFEAIVQEAVAVTKLRFRAKRMGR